VTRNEIVNSSFFDRKYFKIISLFVVIAEYDNNEFFS